MCKKSIIIAISVMLAATLSMNAQTINQSEKQPAKQTEKQTGKQQIDSSKVKDILYLLKISGTSDFAYLIIDDVIKNYKQYITNVPGGYWDKIVAETDIKPFMNSIVGVYDSRFSKEEVKELIRFFESEVGNKWAIELKNMNEEVMTQANTFGQNLFNDINKKLIKDGYINQPEPADSKKDQDNKNKQK